MDLAAPEVERDAAQGLNTAERLGHIVQPKHALRSGVQAWHAVLSVYFRAKPPSEYALMGTVAGGTKSSFRSGT
jgi:hypothetical protein